MSVTCKIFVLCFFASAFLSAQNQNIKFEHITTDQGLSSNTVFCLLQDSRGFLWIGTYDGLNKYDGYKFTVYKNQPGDPFSISNNMIGDLCEDKLGNIWTGSTWGGGLNKFDYASEKFIRYLNDPENSSGINSNLIRSVLADSSGNIWIGTEDAGLDYLDVNTGIVKHYIHNENNPYSISSNMIYKVFLDSKNNLWIGTGDNGLNKYLKVRDQFISFKANGDEGSIGGNRIVSISEDPFGFLWIGTEDGGLNKFDPYTNKFEKFIRDPKNSNSLSDNRVYVVDNDSKNLIWIGTDYGGLNLFDWSNKKFIHFQKKFGDPGSISDDLVYSILEDRSGILWFGTWSGGINKYDREKEKFITYSYNPNSPFSLSSNGVFAIHKDKFGDVWVGTETGGLTRINEKKNEFTWYQHNPDDPGTISSDVIYSITEDKDGTLWIGTGNAGICSFDRQKNKFKRFATNGEYQNSMRDNKIYKIFYDSYGELWIGFVGGGVDKFKPVEKKFIHYENDPSDPGSVSSQLVYIFFEDNSRNLWIGTLGDGLMLYNRKTDNFSYYRNNPENAEKSLSNNAVASLCEDKGILWIGTNGGGLNRFDRSKNLFKTFTEKNGLANNVVNGILSDNKGNLWISTAKGISKFNIKSETFTNYFASDGLQGNDFNGGAYYKSQDGEIFFGGTNGLNKFHPEQIKENSFLPPIVITDFRILHKPVEVGYDSLRSRTILEKSISEMEIINLNHYDNILTFEIAALDFHSPEKNRYAYMLEGFDQHWIYTDAENRSITYTNLEPGEYTLRVKGSNNDGIWNQAGTSLKIIINPPWWSTWWSYIIYGILLSVAFTISTRIYLNRQRLKTQLALEYEHSSKLEEIDKMKSTFYTNISHEFRTPLMLILGPADRLVTKLNDEDGQKQIGLIKANAKRLLNLINQLLDLSRLEAGRLKLNAALGNISQFVKGLAMEFESIAERKDISLKIIIEKEDIEAYFDKEKMEKIITNLLSNALKFTSAGGRITVMVKSTLLNQVEIVVRDSGIGISKSEIPKIFDRFYQVDGTITREHEGTGIGLALTKELIELHKGNISVDSVEGQWTEVKISLPLGKSHLSDNDIIEPSDYQLRKIDSLVDSTNAEQKSDDSISEHLLDKTIVLIVEDNPDVRDFIKDALKENYHIEVAANGEQGLRKAEKVIPDLIISDIMMPKMDGYEMMRKLRVDEKTSHIPIILLTAKSDKDSKLQGLGLGADDYLTKPFDTDELIARIKNLVETRRMLQEKFGSGSDVLHRPAKSTLNSLDEQFLDRIMVVINEHLSEEEFSIEEFGKDVGMSRSQIHRKLKALTGKSTSVYLRTVRLAKAKEMIEQKKGNISDICYAVGFSSPAYFSRCFRDEFGYAPSEHIK